MTERFNYMPAVIEEESDRFESDNFITEDDYILYEKNKSRNDIKIDTNNEEGVVIEQVTHNSSIKDLLDEDEEIKVRTEDGREYYLNNDNSEMYRNHKKTKPTYRVDESLVECTPEKEKHWLLKGTLVRNVKGANFRKGYTDDECVVKRVLTEDNKWPTVDGLNKYMAISEVRFSFQSNTGDGKMTLSFNPGEFFMAPRKCENKDKKKK